MDELIRYGQKLWALDSYLRASLCQNYTTAQLFGIGYELKYLDCKNIAFDPDKLQDMGVIVGNIN